MSSLNISLEDDEPWEVSKKIFDILCDYLQPNTPLSAKPPAVSLAGLFPENRPVKDDETKESAETFLLEMWQVVLKVAVQLEPESVEQQKLVSLLQTLRQTKPARTLQIWNQPTVLWKDLPLLGPTMTETFNAIDNNALYSNHAAWDKDRQRAHSFFTFAALLTRVGFDSSSFALYLFSSALEYPLTRHDLTSGSPAPKTHRTDGPALQTVLQAVKFWLVTCHDLLLAHSKNNRAGPGVKGELWTEQPGFSLARYTLWKGRLEEIASDTNLGQETREVAAAAAGYMTGESLRSVEDPVGQETGESSGSIEDSVGQETAESLGSVEYPVEQGTIAEGADGAELQDKPASSTT